MDRFRRLLMGRSWRMGIARFSFPMGNEISLCPMVCSMVCPVGRNQTELLVLNYVRRNDALRVAHRLKEQKSEIEYAAMNFRVRKMQSRG